jgi:drug/metabolite transporter (DMT)-like permease
LFGSRNFRDSRLNPSAAMAIAAAVLFGAAVPIAKLGFRHIPATLGASLSIPTTAVMFWCLAPFFLEPVNVHAGAAGVFALVGLVFPAAVTLLVFNATERMGPTVSNSVSSTAPIFAILAAVIFLGESLTPGRLAGAIGIVLGIIALSRGEKSRPRAWPVWMLLLPLSAAVIRGGALVLTKFGLILWPSPFAAGLIGYTVSAVVVLGAGRFSAAGRAPVAYSRALPWFAAVGLLNGTAVLLTYAALGKGDVGIVSPIVAASPLFTLALSTLLFRQEKLTVRLATGAGVTVAGVVLLITAG